jgi:hypothetical protein
VVAEIRAWCFAQGAVPRSALGKAIRYVLKLWDGLTLFLDAIEAEVSGDGAEARARRLTLRNERSRPRRASRSGRASRRLLADAVPQARRTAGPRGPNSAPADPAPLASA